MAKRWYLVHTFSDLKKARDVKDDVFARLAVMNLEHYVTDIEIPEESVTKVDEKGNSTTTNQSVYPGYMLIRMELNDLTRSAIRDTPGITGFVGAGGVPTPLSRAEYDNIVRKGASGKSGKASVARTTSSFEVGQAVKVIAGPLKNFDGVVSEVSPLAGKIKVLLSIFGRETPAELAFDQVEKIN